MKVLEEFKDKWFPKYSDFLEVFLKTGTTANVVYIDSKNGKAYCANLGDSRSMYSSKDG